MLFLGLLGRCCKECGYMEVPILFIMIWYLLLVMCLGRNDTLT